MIFCHLQQVWWITIWFYLFQPSDKQNLGVGTIFLEPKNPLPIIMASQPTRLFMCHQKNKGLIAGKIMVYIAQMILGGVG